jgi:hypothetical protein
MTKIGPIDFDESLAICMKNPFRFMAIEENMGVASNFWAHKMHVN